MSFQNDVEWGKDLLRRSYDIAMSIDDERAGRLILHSMILVSQRLAPEKTTQEHFDIIRQNLGYMAGYHSNETRLRVERVFNCVHPIFGPAKDRIPTPEEAFNLGKQAGALMKQGQLPPPRFAQPPAKPPYEGEAEVV